MIAWLLACAAPARLPDPAAGLLAELDVDHSGRVDRGEAPWLAAEESFATADADHDDALDVTELARWLVLAAPTDLSGASPPGRPGGDGPGPRRRAHPPGGASAARPRPGPPESAPTTFPAPGADLEAARELERKR